MVPALKYPCKMVNLLMAQHSCSIFWQTIHKLAYSRAWRLSSRNAVPTEVYCQILCSFVYNVLSSNVCQAAQIVAASASSLVNQILLHKNQSSRNSLNNVATVWYSTQSFTEVNFIEQCWGFVKHVYCELPATSSESDLERNVLYALASIPIESMCRWVFTVLH